VEQAALTGVASAVTIESAKSIAEAVLIAILFFNASACYFGRKDERAYEKWRITRC
jgi:hypothetical protein